MCQLIRKYIFWIVQYWAATSNPKWSYESSGYVSKVDFMFTLSISFKKNKPRETHIDAVIMIEHGIVKD